jgi:predicted GNAT family N-acyltransferase
VNMLEAMELDDQDEDDVMSDPDNEVQMTLPDDMVDRLKKMKKEKEMRDKEDEKRPQEPGWGPVMVERKRRSQNNGSTMLQKAMELKKKKIRAYER